MTAQGGKLPKGYGPVPESIKLSLPTLYLNQGDYDLIVEKYPGLIDSFAVIHTIEEQEVNGL